MRKKTRRVAALSVKDSLSDLVPSVEHRELTIQGHDALTFESAARQLYADVIEPIALIKTERK